MPVNHAPVPEHPEKYPQKLKEELHMKLQPLGDRVVVTPTEEAESRTPSGLVIPDTAKEKPQVGEVIAVGPGARDDDGERVPMDLSVGDKVLYSKFAGTEVKLDSGEYLVLSERDILAIVN